MGDCFAQVVSAHGRDSRTREIFAFGIRLWILEYGSRNPESRWRLESGIQGPLTKNPESSTRSPESTAWNPEFQDCLLGEIYFID